MICCSLLAEIHKYLDNQVPNRDVQQLDNVANNTHHNKADAHSSDNAEVFCMLVTAKNQ